MPRREKDWEKHARVLGRRLDGATIRTIAAEERVSLMRVSQILAVALEDAKAMRSELVDLDDRFLDLAEKLSGVDLAQMPDDFFRTRSVPTRSLHREMAKLWNMGVSMNQIAKTLDVHPETVARWVKRLK